jgi:hypothetical protein
LEASPERTGHDQTVASLRIRRAIRIPHFGLANPDQHGLVITIVQLRGNHSRLVINARLLRIS